MSNYRLILFIIFILSGAQSCSSLKELTSDSKVVGSIEQAGLINGLPAGTTNADGSLAYCESSAVINLGDRLLIANDKPAPNENVASIFSIPVQSTYPAVVKEVQYEQSIVLNNSSKIEAMAKSPATNVFFASTAFDRIKTDSPEWDTYNRLMYWEDGKTDAARVLFKTEDQGVVSSKNIREALHRVIRNRKYPNGVSYYKVEGLAVLKDNSLIFGIRELGPKYDDFDYAFMLIYTSFIQSTDGIVINPDWKKVFEFDPTKNPKINKQVGLSALEYHEPTNSIVALTTYEEEGAGFESYLWMIPLDKRITNRTKPVLVLDEQDQPLVIPHKAESFTFLNKNTLFVICDEDRMASKVKTDDGVIERQAHQGVYAIVKIKN